MTINVGLLTRTLAYIQDHSEEWRQDTWRCGSACCFTSHAALLAGWEWNSPVPTNVWMVHHKDRRVMPVAVVAQDELGLSDTQADRLFRASNTMEDLVRIVDDLIAQAAQESGTPS